MTKYMKNITAAIAALSIAMTLALSACSSSKPASDEKTTAAAATEAAEPTTTEAATPTTTEAAEPTTTEDAEPTLTEAVEPTTTEEATTVTPTEAVTEPTDVPEENDETSASNWKEKLLSVNGVIGVEEVVQDAAEPFFFEKYIVTFEQPLDWSNPENGNFPQRVEIGLHEGVGYNVLETNGYQLFDEYFPLEDAPELSKMLEANYINIEHRFFGKSRPEDMTNDDIK